MATFLQTWETAKDSFQKKTGPKKRGPKGAFVMAAKSTGLPGDLETRDKRLSALAGARKDGIERVICLATSPIRRPVEKLAKTQ